MRKRKHREIKSGVSKWTKSQMQAFVHKSLSSAHSARSTCWVAYPVLPGVGPTIKCRERTDKSLTSWSVYYSLFSASKAAKAGWLQLSILKIFSTVRLKWLQEGPHVMSETVHTNTLQIVTYSQILEQLLIIRAIRLNGVVWRGGCVRIKCHIWTAVEQSSVSPPALSAAPWSPVPDFKRGKPMDKLA